MQQQTSTRRWSIDNDDLPLLFQRQQNCQLQTLPKKLGYGRSALFQFDQDLSYIETHYVPSRDLTVLSRVEHTEPRLIVTIDLKGCSRFVRKDCDDIVFNEGYTTIIATQASIGERQYTADKTVTQLRFALNKNWLTRYFGEDKTLQLLNTSGIQILSYHPTSPQAMVSAQQLSICDKTKETNRLVMHGQALSLLAIELSHLCVNTHKNTVEFNQTDAALATSAHAILFTEFKNPPSVENLANRVGINQCKLKKLFHHFFENTPYGVLQEIRMTNAHQLLESTRCQVSVVAEQVGYNHASNFSAAFIKHFGISPKAIKKFNS